MDTKGIADLFVTATGKIEFYWNFFTLTLLALIGLLVSIEGCLTPSLKLLISIGYVVFVLMNIVGLWGSYTFAEALRQDLLAETKAEPDKLVNAQKFLSDRSFMNQRKLAPLIHTVLGASILSAVWFGI